jgi:hypothetical protein
MVKETDLGFNFKLRTRDPHTIDLLTGDCHRVGRLGTVTEKAALSLLSAFVSVLMILTDFTW